MAVLVSGERRKRRVWVHLALVAGMVGLGLTLATPVRAQEPLTLRVSDADGEAGGEIAVVIRTYASRGVGQGQLCVRTKKRPAGVGQGAAAGVGDKPLAEFLGATIFSAQGDATVETTFDPVNQIADVLFASPTASVNALDGPLAVLRFRLVGGLAIDDRFDLELVASDSFVLDAAGTLVPLDLRAGELRILAPGSPLELGADAEIGVFVPGQNVVVGPSTAVPRSLGAATFALRYAPHLLRGPLTVRLDPRMGAATIVGASEPEPGLLLIEVESPDGSFGEVPGMLVEVELPTSPCAATSAGLAVTVEAATALSDPGAVAVPYVTEPGLVPREEPFTADDFESAGLGSWCESPT